MKSKKFDFSITEKQGFVNDLSEVNNILSSAGLPPVSLNDDVFYRFYLLKQEEYANILDQDVKIAYIYNLYLIYKPNSSYNATSSIITTLAGLDDTRRVIY